MGEDIVEVWKLNENALKYYNAKIRVDGDQKLWSLNHSMNYASKRGYKIVAEKW